MFTSLFSTSKLKILLVDDEKFLLEIYSIKFLKSEFDVFACTSVDEALRALHSGYEPDVILFDITMPDASGYEFLEGLKHIHLPKHCLKIALTNEGEDAEIDRMKELGADAHLLKARYTASELVSEVRTLLTKKSRR